MIFKTVIVLCLPIICHAKIQLNVTVASRKENVVIKTVGADNKLVTDYEISLFNITPANLNYAAKIELGRQPDGIYLKDPTPYGNLFHKFKWPETKRSVYIENVLVDYILNEDIVLKTEEVYNNGTGDTITNRSLLTNVENTAYSTWLDDKLPVEKFPYEVNVKVNRGLFRYNNTWKDRSLKSSYMKFGTDERQTMSVKGGQTLVKKLRAKKTILVLQVGYKAEMVGNIVTDYENLYGKYHFYAPTVNNIMKAAWLPNGIRTGEKIEIRCYTDPKLEIYDKASGVLIKARKFMLRKKNRH